MKTKINNILPVGIVQHSFVEDIDVNRARNHTDIGDILSLIHI